MPSVKNPNGPSKNRVAARASSAKKTARQKSAAGRTKVSKQSQARGARPGLRAVSGPTKQLSAKKAKKLEKKMGYAIKRKMDAEGIVEMADAPEVDEKEQGKGAAEEMMEIQ